MTSERLRVSTPTELISAVPYLIGFHPFDSLVVVALRDRAVIFAGRLDLPAPGEPPGDALHLAAVVGHQDAEAAMVVGYGEPAAVTPVVMLAAQALDRAGVAVLDVLRVTDGRFWTYRGQGEHGWPAEGLPCAPENSAVAAAATFAGQVALPDRAALVAQLEPVAGAERTAMTAATARAQAKIADLIGPGRDFGRLVRRAGRVAVRDAERRYRSGGRLLDDEVAWLGLLLVDLQVRDYAWERVGTEDWHRALWLDVQRRVEPAYLPAPASLLGFAAWRIGVGSLARAALERALEQDQEYRMAQLVHEALVLGLSPALLANWPNVRRVDFDAAQPDDGGRAERRGRPGSPAGGDRPGSSGRATPPERPARRRAAGAGRDRQPARRRRRRAV
jgi:hypothetical protein